MIMPTDSKESLIFRQDSTEDLRKPTKLMIIPSRVLDTSKTLKHLDDSTKVALGFTRSIARRFPTLMCKWKVHFLLSSELADAVRMDPARFYRPHLTSAVRFDDRNRVKPKPPPRPQRNPMLMTSCLPRCPLRNGLQKIVNDFKLVYNNPA
ncbi:uncharacterized protein LOC105218162 [Zeugodacus cucurbitae]|uniref:uncharacterized protein LOC105218162 n=1 Tax=Zeugodacus cucurbitae TaxID=28588 RepID=UPI00059684DD|nr:uncharacterized protein LOC105218162 [Zeugodacus cucurbitae]XP_011191884.1 uncharacterized protein LOC105218162 [Zeugodacus cucurbitae]